MLKRLARAWLRLVLFCAMTALLLHATAEDQFQTLMKEAFALHQQGNFSAALPLLRRAERMQPDDYFVNLLIGIDSLRSGDASAAIPFLRKASRLRPREEYPFSYLGEAYARRNFYADAAASYMKAVDVAPTSAESSIAFVDFALARFADISTVLRGTTRGLAEEYRLRARALERKDSGRIPLLERAGDLDPKAPGIWSELSEASAQSGDWPGANEQVRRAMAEDPDDLAAWIVEAELAAHAGDWKDANDRLNAIATRSSKILSRAAARWPMDLEPPGGAASGSAAVFFRCVREKQPNCDIPRVKPSPTAASDLFRQQRWEDVTKLPAPTAAGAKQQWIQRGIAFAQVDACDRAIPSLERAIEGSSPNLYGMFQLSWCYSQEAGRIAQQVQKSAGNDASLHTMRGDILLRLQAKPELAVEEYQQAIAMAAQDPSLLERLAAAQFGAGKTDAARANANAALKLDPHRWGAMRTLAKIAIQDRDYTAALPYLKQLAEQNPDDVTGRIELGKAYAQTGALNEARETLAPALERGYPDEKGTLHYLLGTVLKRLGQTADAELAFAKASQLSDAFQQKSYRDQDTDARP